MTDVDPVTRSTRVGFPTDPAVPSKPVALWLSILFITIAVLAGVIFWVVVLCFPENGRFAEIAYSHFTTVVGIPAAAGAAFIVVTMFRQAEGPIKLRGLGFEVEGAGGPVVLWVVAFLAICGAIKLIW